MLYLQGWDGGHSSRIGGATTHSSLGPGFDSHSISLSLFHKILGRSPTGELSSEATQELHRRLGEAAWRELQSIAQEPEPELFFRELYQFAKRQEQSGREDLAAVAYATIEEASAGVGEATRSSARESLRALQGLGPLRFRTELLFRALTRETLNPSALLAMGVAGALFRMTRLTTLRSLLQVSEAGFWTRGLGVRGVASLAAFLVEAPAFPMLERLGNEALGKPQEWQPAALRRDVISSFFALGGMRVSGLAGDYLSSWVGWNSPWQRELWTQASVLSGIYLGRGLAQWGGWRPVSDGATTLVDSLALLLQFRVAGQLSSRLFGGGFHIWEQRLDAWAASVMPSPAKQLGYALSESITPLGGLRVFNISDNSKENPGPAPAGSTSSWPPRESGIRSQRTQPPLESPAEESSPIDEALPLLVPHSSAEPVPLNQRMNALKWLVPQDRRLLLRQALTHANPDQVLERIVVLTMEVKTREAELHSIRLLQAFHLELPHFPAARLHWALHKIQASLPPALSADRVARWDAAKHRLRWILDGRLEGEAVPNRILDFELELEKLNRLRFPLQVVEDVFDLSRGSEAEGPMARKVLAAFALRFAPLRGVSSDPWSEFMNGYYLVERLAETGQFDWAQRLGTLLVERSRTWDIEAVSQPVQEYLRGRWEFQKKAIAQYSAILERPERQRVEQLYQFYAMHSGEHFPRPWGLFRALREQAERVWPKAPELGQKRLQLAASLLNTLVLDPVVSRRSLAAEELIYHQARLLELAIQHPHFARSHWNEPVSAMLGRLAEVQEWDGTYDILDAFYHMNLVDPMVLKNTLLSVVPSLEVRLHQMEIGPSQNEIKAQIQQFSDFGPRVF